MCQNSILKIINLKFEHPKILKKGIITHTELDTTLLSIIVTIRNVLE